MDFTKHFREMIEERSIHTEWVDQALQTPDRIEDKPDGTRHFLKQIPEHGGRWLRVVTNINIEPNRAVTAFFDRRLRRNTNED